MLKRKMLRDIKKNLSQFITIFLMVMIGIMVYTTMLSYSGAMQKTGDTYYKKYNLFDLETFGENFTKDDLDNIKKIDNVKDAERKLTVRGTNKDNSVEINFIESNKISKFYIIKGEKFDVNKKGVWIDSDYAKNNNIKLGDTIKIKYESLELNEKVLGLINTPDHVYSLKDSSALMPDKKTFGYVYLSVNEITEDYIKSLVMKETGIKDEELFNYAIPNFNYKDYYVFNDIMIDLDKTDSKVVNKTINNIEDKVENVLAVTKREDNSSVAFYQGEINEGQDYVGIFSGLFIFIALLSVITTMTRVVKKQRIQIGTLKALGFNDFKILMHYIGYGFWITLAGIIAGILIGHYGLTNVVLNMQMSYFQMPFLESFIDSSTFIVSGVLLVLVSVITFLTGRNILKKNAAETLRNEIPQVKSKTINITRKDIFNKFSFSTKWNIRDILRNKARTFMGIVGITGCSLLIVVSMGMIDSFDNFIDMQFTKLYNFDYKLTLSQNITDNEYDELIKKYDKSSSSLGIEIKNGDERITTSVNIIDSGNYLRYINEKDEFIKIDSDKGVYLTRLLAEKNNIKLGDKIKWHILGSNKIYESKVVGLNKDPQVQNMTMTREYYESLGLTYKADYLYTNDDLSKTDSINGVEYIQGNESLKENLDDMMSMVTDLIVLIVFLAVILGAVIIYNMGVLSYGEKEYQFATLKVLGFDNKKIKRVFIKQNIWISIVSAILGMPCGYYITDYVFTMVADRDYDFGATITIKTYIISFIVTVLCSYLVSLFLTRKIKKIDMVTTLKGNE